MTTAAGTDLVHDEVKDLIGSGGAVFSADRVYRYLLLRRWGQGKRLPWVMLNPSTASASEDDPTIRRCAGFARREGYGGIAVVNLFALRSADPRALAASPDPVGPRNDEFLAQHCQEGWDVVVAWGAPGGERGRQVARMLTERGVRLRCFGTTHMGHPKHPLYLGADTPLRPFGESL